MISTSLASKQIAQSEQQYVFSKETPENHERARNVRANCKAPKRPHREDLTVERLRVPEMPRRGMRPGNRTGHPCVSLCLTTQRFRVRIWLNGRSRHIGRFDTIQQAAAAYERAIERHGIKRKDSKGGAMGPPENAKRAPLPGRPVSLDRKSNTESTQAPVELQAQKLRRLFSFCQATAVTIAALAWGVAR